MESSKNRSNVEKHTFDLFFDDSFKISEFLSEDQGIIAADKWEDLKVYSTFSHQPAFRFFLMLFNL